jgi:hypothetical protein
MEMGPDFQQLANWFVQIPDEVGALWFSIHEGAGNG